MKDFLIVGGMQFPPHKSPESPQTTITIVEANRNSEGVLVVSTIGRNQTKFTVEYQILTDEVWKSMLEVFNSDKGGQFIQNVRYYDQENGFVERNMYRSNITATPFKRDENGKVLVWKDCALTLIDTGNVDLIAINFKEVPSDIKVGDVVMLEVIYTPENASEKTLEWTSSDENVITISQFGVIEGISVGVSTITGVSLDGGHKITATINVVEM